MVTLSFISGRRINPEYESPAKIRVEFLFFDFFSNEVDSDSVAVSPSPNKA